MDTTDYRIACQRTRNPELSTRDQLFNAALGLGEAGELQGIIKKQEFHGHKDLKTKVLDESGDILYYIDWTLELYGFTLNDAFDFNAAKLEKRYPEGFSHERSINRE